MTTSRDARDVALARLAARQHGLLSRAQLARHGADHRVVRRRLDSGRYLEVAEHVVAVAGAPATWEQFVMAAVLSSGDGAVASHQTAATLLGLSDRRPAAVDVTTPRPQRRGRDWRAHRSRDLAADHIVSVRCIPVTNPPRTVLDVAGVEPWRAQSLADQAVRLGSMQYADLGRLVSVVARKGRPGVTVCRELVAERLQWSERSESELEDRFVALLRRALVPVPDAQVDIVSRTGAFICRADFAYPSIRVAVELDGYRWHSDVAAFGKDRRVQNLLVEEGWRIYRYTWWDVDLRPEAIIAQLRPVASEAAA
jgi:very-short-patch-repair endonuclease